MTMSFLARIVFEALRSTLNKLEQYSTLYLPVFELRSVDFLDVTVDDPACQMTHFMR